MSNVLLRDVCKSYGTIRALRDLNLACNNGELLVVFGPSGAGKTTLLKLVAGFETHDSGQILLDSQGLPASRPNTGTSRWHSRPMRYIRT